MNTATNRSSLLVNWRLAFSFAKRFYNASYENRYIRFINRASRVGIALGVAALIIGLSIMNGFERELKNTLLSVIPDVEFEAVSGKLDNWPETLERISADPSYVAAAPYIKINAMLQKQQRLDAIVMHGIDPNLEKSVSTLPSMLTAGSWLEDKGAVIGQGLAERLGINVGDRIEFLIPSINERGQFTSPQYLQLKVEGIYQVGGQLDYSQVYVAISTLQQLFSWSPQHAEGIKVELDDPFNARLIANRIGGTLTDYVYVLDWFRANGHVYNDIVLVKDIMYLVMVLVMAVACFNIVSSLTMAVQEKYSDIGILKTMGLTDVVIVRIFTLMGLLTALKGVLWGVIYGVVIAWYLPEIFSFIESLFGVTVLDSDVYFINYIPSELMFNQVVIVAGTAVVVAYLATIYPSKQAGKLNTISLLQS